MAEWLIIESLKDCDLWIIELSDDPCDLLCLDSLCCYMISY